LGKCLVPWRQRRKARRSHRKARGWIVNGIAFSLLGLALAWLVLPNFPRPTLLESWPKSGWEDWAPMYRGVTYRRGHFQHPRPMKIHALRIDLDEPGVGIFVKPDNGDRDGDTDSEYTSRFLRRNDLQLAVSGGAFHPFVKFPYQSVHLDNFAISNGRQVAAQSHNLDSLVISRDRRASLYRHGTDPIDLTNAWQAVGGAWITLQRGTNVAEKLAADAASACGVSRDGRFLYWLIVDGRQPGYSEGATAEETANMLRDLGADSALNMDGGSVVTLAQRGGLQGFTVLNRPCHPVLSGLQRPIGSIVGIRALALPKP
jgi:hypothetical protein